MDAQVIVIGAGLSGLTTAYGLQKAGTKVVVLEAEARVGGCIKTDVSQNYMLEHGPNSMMVNRSQVLDFIESLGLSKQMIDANPDASNRFIVKRGSLHPLPSGPLSFLTTPLFSLGDKLRLFKEPFIGKGNPEESIAEFVKRRLGKGFYEYAINPFVSGVYAGDPEKLEARAAVKKIWDLEAKHGSLIRGGFAMMRGKDRPEGRIKGRLLSFQKGMGTLPHEIASQLGDTVQTNTPVEHLQPEDGGWCITSGTQRIRAKKLVLATPAKQTAQLLSTLSQDASNALNSIPYAPVAVVHLAFTIRNISHPLNGFGCLIPRKEQIKTLGTLFSSTLFPGRCGNDQVLLTCFIGGATFPQILDWDDETIISRVQADLKPLVGIKGEPEFSNLVRWQGAIPQYTHGHLDRIGIIQAEMGKHQGLYTRANWSDGISVPDCIQNGLHLARSI